MDDILLFYVERPDFDHEDFNKRFCESEFYLPPLRLEDGGANTFLETTFEITEHNTIRHWLKNDNKVDAPPKIWRYAHFASYADFAKEIGIDGMSTKDTQNGK